MARQSGVLIGNTGYGYGDTDVVAGSVALVANLADQLTATDSQTTAYGQTITSGQPIGFALAAASTKSLVSCGLVPCSLRSPV